MKDNSSLLDAKIKFSNGEFEISGSEEFVTKQIDEFKNILLGMLDSHLQKNDTAKVTPLVKNPAKLNVLPRSTNHDSKDDYAEFVEIDREELKKYENVFVIDGDRVQIVCDMAGSSTAKRMINLILIYLYIKQQLNIHEVSFGELRDVCEKHGEIDKANFAKHMSLNRKFFIINGVGKGQTAKLIRPGIKEAENLLQQLNHNN